MKGVVELQYKLIGSNDVQNLLESVLKNRGITDYGKYLRLTQSSRETYHNLSRIQDAVHLFDSHFANNHPMAILVDNDVDGVTSATIMYKYIKSLNEDYDVRLYVHQKNKSHGLDGDFEIDNDIKLLIVPDAGSNDVEQHKYLDAQGISCLCLDHHHTDIDIYDSPAIIVNNQTSDSYQNKGCCGASITLEFCRALDEFYWEDISDSFLDLAAVANVCDIMPLTEFETRAIVNEGLNNINNQMLKEIIKAQDFSMKGIVSPHTVGFYVGPLINAFIRLATFEERQLLVRAFCENESETFWYTKRGEDFPTEENIYEHVTRLAKSYKSKQDRIKTKVLPELMQMADSKNKVVMINATEVLDTALTGVVAIKVSEELHAPVLLLQQRADDENIFGGSGRCFDNCPVEDFRALVDECPYTNFSQGHSSAFGIEIPKANIELVQQWLNEQLADVFMEKVYKVDFEVDAADLEISMFQTLDRNKTLWGHGVHEPLFAIKNLHISAENAKVCGKKQDTIQIYDENTNVKYVMFFCKEDNELLQWISNNWGDQEADITVVGTLGINLYEGRLNCQVNIKDFTIQN